MECPFCGAENRDSSRYCGNCGRLMSGGDQNSTVVNTKINSSSLAPGARLQSDRYVVKSVLGQGGMGAALLATDTRLDDKPVVIKELISDASSNNVAQLQDDVRNFRGEVSVLARIDHPLVPNVTDHFQEGNHYFMVQEYAEGENLEDHLERIKAPMPEGEVLGYASAILDVLDYLEHQTPPIIHRDIKPANIIIGARDKRPHLVDFGIARSDTNRNAQRKQTTALGTPGYAPPEQYQGNADGRSDLYALAATMHHLLTNRDPRNHPPFVYPPVRSLNPRLSPEIERILEKALVTDSSKRYQTAVEMKQDIDDLLVGRFGGVQNTGSYILGTSSSIKKVPPTQPASKVAPAPAARPAPQAARPNVQNPLPVYGGGQRQAMAQGSRSYSPPPNVHTPPQAPARTGNNVGRNFLLFLIFIVVLAIFAYAAFNARSHGGQSTGGNTGAQSQQALQATQTASASNAKINTNGIGATTTSSGDLIGVSDGTVAFDTNRPNRQDDSNKLQASQELAQKNVSGALTLWQNAVNADTGDAEALIYMEDQRVVSSGSPYITLVVGTILSGNNAGVGRDDLQGAYVAQKEFNDSKRLPNGTQIRLLIANAGGSQTNATSVAQQIVQAAQSDHTIVGVMGWPFSTYTLQALGVFSAQHIPLVSQTASSDLLSNRSSYFFRVAPSNKDEAIVGAKYVEQKLKAKTVALFVDPVDAYSSSLANDFKNQFTADGNQVVATETYTVGKSSDFPGLIQNAVQAHPDAIYFAGQGSDAGALLTDLPTSGTGANTPVVGGDSLYQLGGYPSSARANFHLLHFTAFAYPDIWGIMGKQAQQPTFFKEYPSDFDPNNQHAANPYGYRRPTSDVMLSFDAMQAMLTASGTALNGKTTITPTDVQQGLAKIAPGNAIQGVSGQIAFDANGDPVNKLIVVLKVSPENFITVESTMGQFLK